MDSGRHQPDDEARLVQPEHEPTPGPNDKTGTIGAALDCCLEVSNTPTVEQPRMKAR
jgi:hypothetical protein